MIRAIRPNAMAQDDASMVAGWNVAPNLAYALRLLPSSVSCGVFLYSDDGTTLIASGAALAGTEQPCILIPQAGQTVDMVDADLGWHLLLTTTGTESQRTIRLGHAVDLPDEIHPVYGVDDLAVVRAAAAINAAAHYIDDVTVTCPLGLGADLGGVVSVPVDGVAVIGQVEGVTWTGTPDGTSEQAVIRRHIAIAPEAFVEIVPPTVADDAGAATHLVGTSGNVLANDESGLTVVAVNGLSSNVGTAVDGDNGGTFAIAADGSWTFAPDGDFALLSGSETADTSITYHASDGSSEAMATLTVTVSHANAAPVAVNDTGTTDAATTTSGNVLTNDTDADADSLTVSQVAGSAANVGVAVAGSNGGLFTVAASGVWTFDPDGDFAALTGTQTATTSATYHVSDGVAEDEGTLTVTVSAASAALWTPAMISGAVWVDADTVTLSGSAVTAMTDKIGGTIQAAQGTSSARPALVAGALGGQDVIQFDGGDFLSFGTTLGKPSNWTVFVLGMFASMGSKTNMCGSGNSGGNSVTYWGDIGIGRTANDGKIEYTFSDGTNYSFGRSTNTVVSAGSWFMCCRRYTSGQSVVADRVNGVAAAVTKEAGTATSCGGTAFQYSLGRSGEWNGQYATNGSRLKGFVCAPSAISDADAARLEGYYAHLCGLTSLLPSGHPYKSSPPYVE
jgi:VCBS repeat-containing protein